MAIHLHQSRVYYEDTDMGGVVYHANYLKFIERGRSDWVRSCGIDQNTLKEVQGLVFVVRRIAAEFRAPARLNDLLTVETQATEFRGARILLHQRVLREATCLFEADVELALMTGAGKPTRLPADIRAKLAP
ncbi:MAG: tol-pal system-associated acyl-CoA thioesterase [Pseudomonadota bacterium]